MTTREVPVVSGEELDAALKDSRPVLLLIWAEDSPRSEVNLALKEVAERYGGRLRVLKVDARDNPELIERFEVGKRPVLIGWYNGEERLRRSRPWNTDVIGMAADLLALLPPEEQTEEAADEDTAAANGKPVHVTDQTFARLVLQSKLPVVVDFWADWCQPCKMVAPILERLAAEYAGKVRIAKVDVDANPMLAQQFQIRSIPTLMFVKNGKIVGQAAGAAPEPAIRNVIDQLIALQV